MTNFDDSLIAEIVARKFVDHLPLYRVAENLSREQNPSARLDNNLAKRAVRPLR